MTTSFVNIDLSSAHMHSLACVPNDTLKVRVEGNPHAANLHMLPKSLGSKVQSALLVTYSRRHSLGCKVQSVLLVTCSRHWYSSAQKESRYCCQDEDQVPKGLHMGDHVYFLSLIHI